MTLQTESLSFGLNTTDPQQLKQRLTALSAESIKTLMEAFQVAAVRQIAIRTAIQALMLLVLYGLYLFFVVKPFLFDLNPVFLLLNGFLFLLSLVLLLNHGTELLFIMVFALGFSGLWNVAEGTLNQFSPVQIIYGAFQLLLVPPIVNFLRQLPLQPGKPVNFEAPETLRALRTNLDALQPGADPDTVEIAIGGRRERLVLIKNVAVLLTANPEAMIVPEGRLIIQPMVAENSERSDWPVEAKFAFYHVSASMPREAFQRYANWKQSHHPLQTRESLQLVGTNHPDWFPLRSVSTIGRIILIVLLGFIALVVFLFIWLANSPAFGG